MTRRHAPATDRNREPIYEVLRRFLASGAEVLEIASGTGQHAAFLAPNLGVRWQPTDVDPDALPSIDAWCSGIDGIAPARVLDTTKLPWPVTSADAIFCANMIHIAPFAAYEGLVAGAGDLLGSHGILCLYGPYRVRGEHIAPSNAAFDQSLRARDPS